MPADDSGRVTDLFAAAAREWTPAAAQDAVRVLYAPVFRNEQALQHCVTVLSNAERERADRFVTEEGRAHFRQRRAFRRYCGALAHGASRPLAQIVFRETDNGRPYLPDLPQVWFSFSACRQGFLGAWSSTHAVGVDIEDRARCLEAIELARAYFSEAEAKAIEAAQASARRPLFLKLWTLKEAALKSIGEGLPFGLDVFQFELAPALRIVRTPHEGGEPRRFEAHLIETADTCAALVLREGHCRQQAL
jgi:phosphopantetheine--protein transferase-like protein